MKPIKPDALLPFAIAAILGFLGSRVKRWREGSFRQGSRTHPDSRETSTSTAPRQRDVRPSCGCGFARAAKPCQAVVIRSGGLLPDPAEHFKLAQP